MKETMTFVSGTPERSWSNKYLNLSYSLSSDILPLCSPLSKLNKKPMSMEAIDVVNTGETPGTESRWMMELVGQTGNICHRGEV